jgi:hypothetical protein
VSSERLRSFFHVLCTSAVIDCIYPQKKKLKQIFASLEKKAPHGFRGSHVSFCRHPFVCFFQGGGTSMEIPLVLNTVSYLYTRPYSTRRIEMYRAWKNARGFISRPLFQGLKA